MCRISLAGVYDLFANKNLEELSPSERQSHVFQNPHILDWVFPVRTDRSVKYWLYDSLGASWHWYRYEYAVQRGSIHCHGIAKLNNDPGLCELTEVFFLFFFIFYYYLFLLYIYIYIYFNNTQYNCNKLTVQN